MPGVVTTIPQSTVYALPPVRVLLFCDTATPNLLQSNTSAFTASVAVTLTNGQAELAGGFIQSTTATTTVLVKTF